MIGKILLFLSCGLAVVADMLLVWWSKNESHPIWSLVSGMVLLVVSGLLWAYTMYRGIESVTAITTYSILTVLGCSFLGMVVFGEPMSVAKAVGGVLALVALVLLSR